MPRSCSILLSCCSLTWGVFDLGKYFCCWKILPAMTWHPLRKWNSAKGQLASCLSFLQCVCTWRWCSESLEVDQTALVAHSKSEAAPVRYPNVSGRTFAEWEMGKCKETAWLTSDHPAIKQRSLQVWKVRLQESIWHLCLQRRNCGQVSTTQLLEFFLGRAAKSRCEKKQYMLTLKVNALRF